MTSTAEGSAEHFVYNASEHMRIPFIVFRKSDLDRDWNSELTDGTVYAHPRLGTFNIWMACVYKDIESPERWNIIEASCMLSTVSEFCGGFLLTGVAISSISIPSTRSVEALQLEPWRSVGLHSSQTQRDEIVYCQYPKEFRRLGKYKTMQHILEGIRQNTCELPSINALLNTDIVSRATAVRYMSDGLGDTILKIMLQAKKRCVTGFDTTKGGLAYTMGRLSSRFKTDTPILIPQGYYPVSGRLNEPTHTFRMPYGPTRAFYDTTITRLHSAKLTKSTGFINWNSGNRCTVYSIIIDNTTNPASHNAISQAKERDSINHVTEYMHPWALSEPMQGRRFSRASMLFLHAPLAMPHGRPFPIPN